LDDLPDGSVIGTSSLRRVAQLKRSYPGLKFIDVVSLMCSQNRIHAQSVRYFFLVQRGNMYVLASLHDLASSFT